LKNWTSGRSVNSGKPGLSSKWGGKRVPSSKEGERGKRPEINYVNCQGKEGRNWRVRRKPDYQEHFEGREKVENSLR